MAKRFLLMAFTLVSATALGSSIGCSSSDTPTEEDEGAGGSAGSSGQSGKGGGGSSGSSSHAGNAGDSKGSGGSSGGAGKATGGSSGTQGTGGTTKGSGGSAGNTGTGPNCTAKAEGHELIDDMSAPEGTQIRFAPTYEPAACADPGTWFDYNSGDGHITPDGDFTFTTLPSAPGSGPSSSDAGTPQSDASVEEDAGTTDASVSEAGRPGPDAGRFDARPGDGQSEAQTQPSSEGGATEGGGGASTDLKGACVKGVTGSTQYNTSGMGINFGTVAGSGNGGNDIPATIDASMFTGIEFQAWGGLSTAQTVIFMAVDKAETPGYGICDPADDAAKACGGASSNVSVNQGWQTIRVPFKNIKLNKYYGGGNEDAFNPSNITQLQWQIQQGKADATAGVEFDLCVYEVKFYK